MTDGLPPNLTLDDIRERLSNLDDADAAIRRAKTAGIDMSANEAKLKDSRQKLLKLKQAYFPGA